MASATSRCRDHCGLPAHRLDIIAARRRLATVARQRPPCRLERDRTRRPLPGSWTERDVARADSRRLQRTGSRRRPGLRHRWPANVRQPHDRTRAGARRADRHDSLVQRMGDQLFGSGNDICARATGDAHGGRRPGLRAWRHGPPARARRAGWKDRVAEELRRRFRRHDPIVGRDRGAARRRRSAHHARRR